MRSPDNDSSGAGVTLGNFSLLLIEEVKEALPPLPPLSIVILRK
jgi:hypothetical protein